MGAWTRRVMWPVVRSLLAAGSVVTGLSCAGEDIAAPSIGSIEISTATSGPEPDGDGYAVTIDAVTGAAIGANATLRRDDLHPGTHIVGLTGTAANCAVEGENPRTVEVHAGDATPVAFVITCRATAGTLEISASTTGPVPDPDGYTVLLDGTERGGIGVSGTLVTDGLAGGEHSVGLSGVAANCQVQGDNPRTVTVTPGASATVAFAVACTTSPAGTGTVRVTTSTTGVDLDPDGYTFALDGGTAQPVGVNAVATLTNVAAGTHTVRLAGVAANCSVSGTNPSSISITAGATTTATFGVTCRATATYRVIDLGTLGGSYSSARAINSAGQVVGNSGMPGGDPEDGLPNAHAFLWENGVMTDLGTLGGGYSSAEDINDAGQVVGFSTTSSGVTHGFLWDKGVMTDLGALSGDVSVSDAMGINPLGQVVGTSYTPIQPTTGGSSPRAYLWQAGVMTDLGTLGGNASFAADINDQGQVVGHSTISGPDNDHAFLWENGVMTDLGTLGPGRSEATGINSAGQIVGTFVTAAFGNRAFLWEKGVMVELGTLGGLFSGASDINDEGQVVGWSYPQSGLQHATLWTRE